MSLRGWREALGETTLSADVAIVGSGPGGAAVARTLAEAGAEVVVLEEGPPRSNFRPNMAHTLRHHMQERGQIVATGNAFIPIGAGRGVGGGSLVNSAICWRTPDAVLEGWGEVLGDDRFAPDQLAPIFDELEALLGVAETPDEIAGENNRLVVRGARALGLPGGLLRRNTPGCVGCGTCNWGCPSGGKASVDRNLVPMARAAGAIVQGDVKVTAILIDGDRVVGVRGAVRDPEQREPVGQLTVRAQRVVVCCGGVGTPRLLHHAGLAERLGPATGRGLHLHPGNGVFALCDHDVHMWRGATQGAYFTDPELPGVLPHTLSLPPGTMLLAMGEAGAAAKESMKRVPRMGGCVVMVSDTGEGTVGATSDGRAAVRYWYADEDIERIKAGMVRVCDVLLAGGARRLLVPVRGVGWADDSAAVAARLEQTTLSDFHMYASHPTASCRMGRDIDTGVIGPDGQAHGLEGLYLADSSVFPTALGVNPQLTTMAVATVIARGIAA